MANEPNNIALVAPDEVTMDLLNWHRIDAGTANIALDANAAAREFTRAFDPAQQEALSRTLDERMQPMLATLPEASREAFRQAFLRFHDLTAQPAADGAVRYAPNPDEERPHPGNLLPLNAAAGQQATMQPSGTSGRR